MTMGRMWEKNVKEYQKCKRMLKQMIPNEYSLSREVAVSGSSALLWWQTEQRIGPEWEGPNDVDVFVAGRPGSNGEVFTMFVNAVIDNVESKGIKIAHLRGKNSTYIVRGRRTNIVDVRISGCKFKMSFVQCPLANNIDEVVACFDIDICKVIYHIHDGSFSVAACVERSICLGTAEISSIRLDEHGPSQFDMARVKKTLERMKKYKERGFKFTHGNAIVFK